MIRSQRQAAGAEFQKTTPDNETKTVRIPTRNLIAAPAQGEGIYAVFATIDAPPLYSGWNQFAYPETGIQPVEKRTRFY